MTACGAQQTHTQRRSSGDAPFGHSRTSQVPSPSLWGCRTVPCCSSPRQLHFRERTPACCSGPISSGRQCPWNSQQRWRYVSSVPHAVRVYAEDHTKDRSLLSLLTMPNTTSMVAWMNMGPSATTMLSSVLSEPLHFSSLHIFMFCIARRLILHPTSCGRTAESTDTGSGTTTSSSMLGCPARRCRTTVSWSRLLAECTDVLYRSP